MTERLVHLLLEDPGLAEGLEGPRRARAERDLRAPVRLIEQGSWEPRRSRTPDGRGFGLLLLSGLLARRVGQRGRFGAELLGPGDLLQPWLRLGDSASIPFDPVWVAISDTRIADLGPAFACRAAPYPEVAEHLVGRALRRSRFLAINLAVIQQPRIETRLHMLLWDLADRWGRVRRDGVSVGIPLTHALLANLVAARRPTVSKALAALARRGVVVRGTDGWLLRGGPPSELAPRSMP